MQKHVVIMTYSDYDKVFEVCTNAWYTQLGIVITQSKKKSWHFATSNCQKHKYNSVTKIENLA